MKRFHLTAKINVVLPLKMDLAKIKRFANSEFESWKIAKAVTEVKNEIKDVEQGRDVVMSDVFKTLRDPLIEQQKKTDAKQDAVIEQLRENQLALTGGLKDLVESNRDVLTLQQELPFPAGVEALPAAPVAAAPAPATAPKGPDVYELNNNFINWELKYIKDQGFVEPNQLLLKSEKELKGLLNAATDERNAYSYQIGAFKRTKNPTPTDKYNNQSHEKKQNLFNKYMKAIQDVLASAKYKTGTGVRKYKQPKRNAYKISDSSYGNLSVDVPRLKNEMKLNVFRGGKIIYHADADKSFVDLLTKRFNPRSKYSLKAVKIFNDLNLLANLPRHPSSGKSKLIGSGVVYYNDPNELAERMKILVGSMAAGNNSPVIRNDLAMINAEFLKIGAINKTTHEKFYEKYIK